MGEFINKINLFSNKSANNQQIQNNSKQQPNNVPKQNENSDSVDLSDLPEGISKFDIDGDKITVRKIGDKIDTQVVGHEYKDINEIYKKIRNELDSKK